MNFFQSTAKFNTIYKERLTQSGHSAVSTHALAFDATWALGQALNYTEQMRMQIMTVNGALNDSIPFEALNDSIPFDCNRSNESLVQISQDCMVKELAQYTDCVGKDGALVPLNEFNYSNAFMGCVIRYNLQRTNFTGMLVSFMSRTLNNEQT